MKFTEKDVVQAKEMTAKAMKEFGFAEKDAELDLSYITVDLLQEYENAQEKDETNCEIRDNDFGEELKSEGNSLENYPCFIGHSPVSQGNTKWKYQNNNTSNGCDRKEHLCGSGKTWVAKCSKVMTDRHCNNGKKGFLGWPF